MKRRTKIASASGFKLNASGFKKYVRPGVTVQVAETTRIDASLQIGAASDTVTVNAEAPLLKTDSGELSHQIDYKQANDIPLFTLNGAGGTEGLGNIRDPLSVLNTIPGASYSTDFKMQINGLPSGTQAVRVEGQDATNGLFQTSNQAVQQGVDAIQEVSIQTSNFAAEYGQVGGGFINYTMKSGTNQFHGSAYDYFQNEFLNAGLPFTVDNAGTGHVKNPIRRNDYGFTFGGPIKIPKVYDGKDKTFFFFSFEQFRQNIITNNLIAIAPLPQWTGGSNPACGTPSAPSALGSSGGCDANFGPTLANGQPNPGNVESPFGPGATVGGAARRSPIQRAA